MTEETTTTNPVARLGAPIGDYPKLLKPRLQQWKFRVKILGEDFSEDQRELFTYRIASASRPKIALEDGIITHRPVTIVLTETKDLEIYAVISKMLDLYGKKEFDFLFETLDDRTDGVKERFLLKQCQLVDADFGEFDYSSSDAVKITIAIGYRRFDYERVPEQNITHEG